MNQTIVDKQFKTTLEKIGRNILNFQKLETGMKFLLSRCFIHGDISTLKGNIKSNIKKQSMKTMGNLVKEYLEKIYTGEQISNDSVLNIQFSVQADIDYIIERTMALEKLVADRNHLVHHRLTKLDTTCLTSCKKLCSELDEQNEVIKFEFEVLRGQAKCIIEGAEYIKNNADAFY
jgi:hypothetical protein